MLIRAAEIEPGQMVDLRIVDGVIAEIGAALQAAPDEEVIEAHADAVLPGLHDHHLHLRALAAARASVRCGPPQVRTLEQLAAALRAAAAMLAPGEALRGVGYHESVAGELDREQLDVLLPDRPLRIQHRSGRLWIFNSAALDALAPDADAPLERRDGRWNGRLLDADDWLSARLRRRLPSLQSVSRYLASRGVTGVTDTTHHNGPEALQAFMQARARGELLQGLRVMGDARLHGQGEGPGVQCGELKFHLHEHALPDWDGLLAALRIGHAQGRASAFHCVTRAELVYALAALREVGPQHGDRIEHAAITPPESLDEIAALGLTVVTQPNFIAERGDDYRRDVDAEDQPWLYRLRGFVTAGVPLALSTDAPFGEPDPWAAMQAAVQRRTPSGIALGAQEALRPEEALAGFLAPLAHPGAPPRRLVVGADADLCLLDRPRAAALADLSAVGVRLTLVAGRAAWRTAGV